MRNTLHSIKYIYIQYNIFAFNKKYLYSMKSYSILFHNFIFMFTKKNNIKNTTRLFETTGCQFFFSGCFFLFC